MMERAPKVAVIVLNWNGWEDTLPCLDTLAVNAYTQYGLLVVDNHSDDDSVAHIRAWAARHPMIPLTLLETQANLGFCGGNNVGIRYALEHGFRHLLILNNDTLVDKDCLVHLVELLESDQHIGIVSPSILNEHGENVTSLIKTAPRLGEWLCVYSPVLTYWRNNYFYRRHMHTDFQFDKPLQVYAPAGCCLLVRREVFEQVGLLDETTFFGQTEFTLAELARKTGFRVYVNPAAAIVHKGGRSTRKMGARLRIEALRSEADFTRRYLHYTRVEIWVLKVSRLLIFLLKCLKDQDYRRHLKAFFSVLLQA